LAADANTRLYFQPAANFNGTIASAITFRAWDQTSGTNGGTADTSPNGGSTAFSTATDTASLTITLVNDAPAITSNGGGATANLAVEENTTAVTTVTSTDIDGGTPVYSLGGGADAGHFSINSSNGVLSFLTAPDFEAPTDSGANNVYEVVVQVSDGAGGFDTQALSIAVTNVPNSLTVFATGRGNGTVTSFPLGINLATGQFTTIFSPGTLVILTATPEIGARFTGWIGHGIDTTADLRPSPILTVAAQEALTYTANFEPESAPEWPGALRASSAVVTVASGLSFVTGQSSSDNSASSEQPATNSQQLTASSEQTFDDSESGAISNPPSAISSSDNSKLTTQNSEFATPLTSLVSRVPVAAQDATGDGRGEGEGGVALAYVQQSWVKDFVTNPAATLAEEDDEELRITLPAGV
jgi:hypothetical protein